MSRSITLDGIPKHEVSRALIQIASKLETDTSDDNYLSGAVEVDGQRITWSWEDYPYYNIEPEFLKRMGSWSGNSNNIEIAIELIRDDMISDLHSPIEGYVQSEDPYDTEDIRTEFLSPYDSMELYWGAEVADDIETAYDTLDGQV